MVQPSPLRKVQRQKSCGDGHCLVESSGSWQDHGWLYQEYLACVFSRWYPHNKVMPQMCSIPLWSWHRSCIWVSFSSSWCASQEKEQLSCRYPPACQKGAWLCDDGWCCSTSLSSVWYFLAVLTKRWMIAVMVFLPPFLRARNLTRVYIRLRYTKGQKLAQPLIQRKKHNYYDLYQTEE